MPPTIPRDADNCSQKCYLCLTVFRKVFAKQRNLLKALHRSAKKKHYCYKVIDSTSAKLCYGATDFFVGPEKRTATA